MKSILTHTHAHPPACKRLQTRTTGMDPPTEDTRFLIHHYSTVDIMWLFTTQPRTSSYTPNRGHGLNSIFTSFSSSCTPPLRTEDRPRCGMCPRSIVKFHMCVLVWRRLQTHTHTPTQIIQKYSKTDFFCKIGIILYISASTSLKFKLKHFGLLTWYTAVKDHNASPSPSVITDLILPYIYYSWLYVKVNSSALHVTMIGTYYFFKQVSETFTTKLYSFFLWDQT